MLAVQSIVKTCCEYWGTVLHVLLSTTSALWTSLSRTSGTPVPACRSSNPSAHELASTGRAAELRALLEVEPSLAQQKGDVWLVDWRIAVARGAARRLKIGRGPPVRTWRVMAWLLGCMAAWLYDCTCAGFQYCETVISLLLAPAFQHCEGGGCLQENVPRPPAQSMVTNGEGGGCGESQAQ